MLIRVSHDGTRWQLCGLEFIEADEQGDHRHYENQVDAALHGMSTLPDALTLLDPLRREITLGLLDQPQQTSGGLLAQYATADHGEPARMPPRIA